MCNNYKGITAYAVMCLKQSNNTLELQWDDTYASSNKLHEKRKEGLPSSKTEAGRV